ncbi:MAG: universal stress protein [Desulfobacterales bacterium]
MHALNYRLATIDRQDPRIVEMVGEANKKFEEEVRPHADNMPIHTFECAPADPGLEICKVARRIGADLILMGSHNETEIFVPMSSVGITEGADFFSSPSPDGQKETLSLRPLCSVVRKY